MVLILWNLDPVKQPEKKKKITESLPPERPSTSTMRLRSRPDLGPVEHSSPGANPDQASTSSENPSSSVLLTKSMVEASDKFEGFF